MTQRSTEVRLHAWTWRGLRWRLEAWITGRPFAEVVLDHALVYRVQQVSLIHRETGLLLAHTIAGELPSPVRAPAVVAETLSAIQDFVAASIGTRDGDMLDAVKVGELTILAEHGAEVSLVAVLRGFAPEVQIRHALQAALAHIQQGHREALRNFQGDVRPFATARGHLEACLLSAE